MKEKIALKGLVLLICLLMLSAPNALAQICQADFDFNGDVYPSDLMVFLAEYGRTDCDPSGPAPVAWSGQMDSYATGDDGDLEPGVHWPVPRFTDNEDGTVTSKLTGLTWLKDADCFGTRTWDNALTICNGLANGHCGLTDGSVAGDWRLPSIKELQSLIDFSQYYPALGFLFTLLVDNVQSDDYWSSTTLAGSPNHAWHVYMLFGHVDYDIKDSYNYVWPVRGGHN